MNIVMTNDENKVIELVKAGFCPVECSINGNNHTDELMMDHHGKLSHLEVVSTRAYRDHFGARANDQRFVCVGQPDADACFAMAALAGILPHPDYDVSSLPPFLHAAYQRDVSGLANTVSVIDTDPIGRVISEMPFGGELLAWNTLMAFNDRTSASAVMGVMLWKQLCMENESRNVLVNAALQTEAVRIRAANEATVEDIGNGVCFVPDGKVWGFDQWYGRQERFSATSLSGWKYTVCVSFDPSKEVQNVTVAMPNVTVGSTTLGGKTFKDLYEVLGEITNQPGWGGHPYVGGNARNGYLTIEQAREVARYLSNIASKTRFAKDMF